MRISAKDALPVYWNVPSAPCKKLGVDIPLSEFEIIHNEGEEFLGEKIVIFYEKKFGKCPYYKNYDPKQPINGGLPQNVSIDEHLAVVEKQINETIPDENFNGIAVIDIEEWRPLYEMNWGGKDVRQTFFMRTLKKAIELRPKALWGLYDFPFCNAKAGDVEGDFECSKKAQHYNDKMDFIYNTTRVLYPSIYLNGKKSPEQNFRFIRALLTETRRIANAQRRRVNYYVYTKFEYDPYESYEWFYEKEDICNTMKLPADLGGSGLVLWSTSKDMRKRCANIAHFMRKPLGPFLEAIRKQTNDCRQTMCSGNGKCVLRKPLKKCYKAMKNLDNYVCLCDRGYQEPDCSQKVIKKSHLETNRVL
ncbi:EGF-like domain protein [Ancylostoma ceylanicum]|uniref:Hyaluronidase n=1 Tax=Ancylostoma ceylanicum TaxID=53326 RepID=A0A0D6LMT5_9BILA|nr:EGF-like domain protein [Ancylostoma ceylanicum]